MVVEWLGIDHHRRDKFMMVKINFHYLLSFHENAKGKNYDEFSKAVA